MAEGLSPVGQVMVDTVKTSTEMLKSKIDSLQQCLLHGQDSSFIFKEIDAACSTVLAHVLTLTTCS